MEFNKKLFKVLCVKELPPAIKDCIIPDKIPNIIDYYLYKIYHRILKKYYYGKHKWNGTPYWHSGEHEELNRLWSTEKEAFDYEILAFGTADQISKMEVNIVTDALIKDPLCWNKQKPIPAKKKNLTNDIKLVNELYEKIILGEWEKIKVKKDIVKDISFKQCRNTKVYREKVLEIADAIQSKNGNTDMCDPLIVLKDRLGVDIDLGINGYHTKSGFIKAKNATEIDVIYVPYEFHKDIPDSLLIRLGNTFNKKDEFIKTDVEADDVLRELMTEYEDGYKHTDDDVRERVVTELGFSGRQAGNFLKKYKKQQKISNANKLNGQTYSKYTRKELNKIKKEYKKSHPNKTIWASSSTTLTLCRVYDNLRKSNSNDALVVIHHPDSIAEERWGKSRKDYFIKNHLYSKSPLEIQYEEVSGWKTDIVT